MQQEKKTFLQIGVPPASTVSKKQFQTDNFISFLLHEVINQEKITVKYLHIFRILIDSIKF